jgi:hypothetical protein
MLVSACPFILSGWLHGFPWEMEALAAVAASGLAGLGALLWSDSRRGVSAELAVERLAVAVMCGALVLATSVGVFLWVATLGIWRISDWTAAAYLGLCALAAAATAVFVSGRHRTSQWSPAIQVVSLLLGVAALLHILRQAAVVCLLVGFGPGAVPVWLWYFPFTGLQPGQLGVAGLALAAIPAVGLLGIRARRRWGVRAALIITDALLALCLLALSYRLVGALAVVGLLLFDAKTQGKGGRVALWVLIVMLCLAPVDVSLQSGAVPGPRWLPTTAGDFTSMDAFLHGPKHGYVVLDTGSHQILYYEPRLVWAW